MVRILLLVWLYLACLPTSVLQAQAPGGGALTGQRHRVLVSTDIGGTDPDDFQSMVHLLMYADAFNLEGLISSPYGPGRKEHILQVIDCYERDLSNLRRHSDKYPSSDALREITRQGAIVEAPLAGIDRATEGSEWIIHCARRIDERPLYVLVWGGLEDLAQALHDAPDILPKLRVYWIGGPNKKWSVNAYQYIVNNHSKLWFIEANATYRGWFVGGNQSGQWGNRQFVSEHVAGRGALGDFFAQQLGASIKMGDTPSVAWLLRGSADNPQAESWGGQFVRAWARPFLRLDRMPTGSDRLEEFGILEIHLPCKLSSTQLSASISVEGQTLKGHVRENDRVVFRFSPKAAKSYTLRVESDDLSLHGLSGTLNAHHAAPDHRDHSDPSLPNWWTDDPSPELMEGPHIGAKSVNRWREAFLSDFAQRLLRAKP